MSLIVCGMELELRVNWQVFMNTDVFYENQWTFLRNYASNSFQDFHRTTLRRTAKNVASSKAWCMTKRLGIDYMLFLYIIAPVLLTEMEIS